MVNKTRIAALMLLPVILLPAAGCARNKVKGDTAYVARDVNTLYSLAKDRADKGQYELAAKLFDEVERQHPYSVWARARAADECLFLLHGAEISGRGQLGPAFPDDPPGQQGRALRQLPHRDELLQQIEDVTRDQKITQQASDSFNELIRRYPQSRYASDARLKLDLINDHLAGKEMEVGRFYQRAGQWLARDHPLPRRGRQISDDHATRPRRWSGWSNPI